jgi:hypothetical protein
VESVIIVAPRDYDVEFRARLGERAVRPKGPSETLTVDDGRRRVYVSRNRFVQQELEPARLRQITALVPTPVFYTLEFIDISLCRAVLLLLADDSELVVDNDHGVVLAGSEFVRVLRSQPDWDWRGDRPQ